MKNTRIIVSDKDFYKYRGPLAVVLIDDKKTIPSFLDKQMKRKIKRILNLGDFSGKIEEQLLMYMDSPGTKGSATAERLLLVGLGSSQESDRARLLDALRSSGGFIAQTAKKIKANDLMVVLPDYLEKIPANGAEQIIEGILLG